MNSFKNADCKKAENGNMVCCDECDKWFRWYVFLIQIAFHRYSIP